MKALAEIGWARAARFGFFTAMMLPYRLLPFPQLRAPWLRLLGARIGPRTILHDVRFFNLYRRGLGGLRIGAECFLGDECLVDLAEGARRSSSACLGQLTRFWEQPSLSPSFRRSHSYSGGFAVSTGSGSETRSSRQRQDFGSDGMQSPRCCWLPPARLCCSWRSDLHKEAASAAHRGCRSGRSLGSARSHAGWQPSR